MSAQSAVPVVPPDHVTVEIDGRSLAVPKNSMIIQAADKAGIAIPRFCYHEKLPIAANCRMCMVEVEMGGKPMAKPQPACATPVADGMKIQTQSAKALSAQRNVMEFLLINHPLDCPICDQGGECELQDLSMGYGRSVSRFVERKRVIADEDLGSLVETEMTRCIQCTRCVRVMAEVAGTYELGGMERGEMLQIGTYVGKPLMSELSGNVIDVCPVGALTDKPYRFKARAWELLARESIGYHDALGSNVWLHTRRGEVLRTVPRDNGAINECWLSDRDRYSRDGLRAPDRATRPQVKRDGAWADVDWNEAIRVASEALRAAPRGEIGALLHPATSNEDGHLIAKLVRALGSEHIDHRLRQLDFADGASARIFDMPVADVEKANLIVLLGCNPRHEMPLLGARIRKAARYGAKIYAINPVDFDFDFEFALAGKRITTPQGLIDAMLGLVKAANDAGHRPEALALADAIAGHKADAFGQDLFKVLADASASLIVIGEGAQLHPQGSMLRAAARFIAKVTNSGCNEIPSGANALGLARVGALPAAGALDAQTMLAQPRKVYLLYGCEPPQDFADGAAAMAALGNADHVVAFASYASEALKDIATVILPIGLLPEVDATLINVDGIAQTVVTAAKSPGEARPGWKVLRAVGSALAFDGFGFTEIGEVRAQMGEATTPSIGEWPPTLPMGRLEDGFASELPRSLRSTNATVAADTDDFGTNDVSSLVRIATTPIYAADAVLRRSPALQSHPLARAACVTLHPEDAIALGLGLGANARVSGVVLPVELSMRVPRGGAWIEAALAATSTLPPYGAALDIVKA